MYPTPTHSKAKIILTVILFFITGAIIGATALYVLRDRVIPQQKAAPAESVTVPRQKTAPKVPAPRTIQITDAGVQFKDSEKFDNLLYLAYKFPDGAPIIDLSPRDIVAMTQEAAIRDRTDQMQIEDIVCPFPDPSLGKINFISKDYVNKASSGQLPKDSPTPYTKESLAQRIKEGTAKDINDKWYAVLSTGNMNGPANCTADTKIRPLIDQGFGKFVDNSKLFLQALEPISN